MLPSLSFFTVAVAVVVVAQLMHKIIDGHLFEFSIDHMIQLFASFCYHIRFVFVVFAFVFGLCMQFLIGFKLDLSSLPSVGFYNSIITKYCIMWNEFV